MPITYRRAASDHDYKMAKALMRKEKVPDQDLGFPTILAFEDGELVGFMGTEIKDNMVVGGPLVVRSDKRRAFTALQLCVEYESDLNNLGIHSYIFSADKGSVVEEAVKRYMHGMEPYAVEGTKKFYIRKIHEDQAALLRGPIGEKNGKLS